MFHMNQNLKVVPAVEPADLRKSLNGLYTIARNERVKFRRTGRCLSFKIARELESRCCVSMAPGTGCP